MKKIFILLIFNILIFLITTQAQDRAAVHGMVVMGTEKIYASHLPMFHSPHGYQVILELKFDKKGKEIYQQAYIASEHKFFTIEPEQFVLPEMIAKPHKFKVNIYEGHFERGGKKIAESVETSIIEVIYSQKLDTKLGLKTINFLLFGNEKEQFAAHLITLKPDFDQIFAVQCKFSELDRKQKYWKIQFPDIPNDAFKKDKANAFFNAKWFKLEKMKQLYLEFDDLK